MNLFRILFFISINMFGIIYACTIGAGYDNDGRPFLFKVRDRNN